MEKREGEEYPPPSSYVRSHVCRKGEKHSLHHLHARAWGEKETRRGEIKAEEKKEE